VSTGFTSRIGAMGGACGFRTRQVEGQTLVERPGAALAAAAMPSRPPGSLQRLRPFGPQHAPSHSVPAQSECEWKPRGRSRPVGSGERPPPSLTETGLLMEAV
jgi:hypothetical protein